MVQEDQGGFITLFKACPDIPPAGSRFSRFELGIYFFKNLCQKSASPKFIAWKIDSVNSKLLLQPSHGLGSMNGEGGK